MTGQYSRYRTSVNVNEPTLAGLSSGSNFGMTQLYQVTSSPPGNFKYEPVVAQPLYVTNVAQTGGGTKNLLVVVSLNDYFYEFDTTSTGETVSPIGMPINLASHCGISGVPFENSHARLPGGVKNLEYYGAVATPVIETANSPTIAYVVSACTAKWGSTQVSWYLDAINLQTGTDIASASISGTSATNVTFNAANQLSRASLLITHTTSCPTCIYVAFGEGVSELGAASDSKYKYSGFVFNYPVTYASGSVSFGTPTIFSTSGTTSSAFPSVYTQFNTNGAPLGPSCVSSSICDHGDNWAVDQGGVWMSGVGLSSDASGYVYGAAGNGPFGCSDPVNNQCKDASGVEYWGQSAFKFTSNTASAPGDFFAPYVQRYSPGGAGSLDPSPASYQTEELSRVDQDFGTSGMVILPFTGAPTYAMTSDKSGFVYVMPAGSNSLGLFLKNDAGLTGGTVSTQIPFQGSRNGPANSTAVCPVNNGTTGQFSTAACDEIHELAYYNYNLFVWPANESVEVFTGSFSNGGNTFSFPTAPSYDPCNTPGNCGAETSAPPFPTANPNSQGGAMALASDGGSAATLWAVVQQLNSAGATNAGTLYAYTVNSGPTLTELWTNVAGVPNAHSCYTGLQTPPATGWFAPASTEPTLAAGKVFVATYCSVTDGSSNASCPQVGASGLASGVLVFSTCP